MLNSKTHNNLKNYIRAANYLSAAQIFLQDNFLLERSLTFDDIKPRLLGHWGSCPGINVIYGHFLRLIKDTNHQNNLFVLGTGHGFPALQAGLWLEESLAAVDSTTQRNMAGLERVCRDFSWPYGFPSHSSPYSPGVISEGGELGYSLATAFGAVLDQPDMLAVCLIGDGEAETGALSGAWHLNKIISHQQNGFVLPILHLNGYKITGPTVFGRMSDKELYDYFSGQRYAPILVDYQNPDEDDHQLAAAFDQAYAKIRQLRDGSASDQRLPMIVFRSPKGMTGLDWWRGHKIAGNNYSHQVILDDAKSNPETLAALEEWLKSYQFEELFDGQKFGDWLDEFLPEAAARPGRNQLAHAKQFDGSPALDLIRPELESLTEADLPVGEPKSKPMHKIGDYLEQIFKLNHDRANFRFFSPDETTSNRCGAIYNQTGRAWNSKIEAWDLVSDLNGRSVEILGEQSLEGMLHGYITTGRFGILPSYESFLPIVSSMVDQQAKFIQQAKDVDFRAPMPPLVHILTSNGWRQDHNGFSHQNPSFIDSILLRQNGLGTVLFPADQQAALVGLDWALAQRDQLITIVAGKTEEPIWRNLSQAEQDLAAGANVWEFASDQTEPDLVLAAAGDYVAKEMMFAQQIIKQYLPEINLRVVYVSALTTGAIGTAENPLSQEAFDQTFTNNQPIIFNFHGYPETIKAILFNYLDPQRISVRGYVEQGSTTTPFDMMARNQTSRYHLAIEAAQRLANSGKITSKQSDKLGVELEKILQNNVDYSKRSGVDLPEITKQVWYGKSN